MSVVCQPSTGTVRIASPRFRRTAVGAAFALLVCSQPCRPDAPTADAAAAAAASIDAAPARTPIRRLDSNDAAGGRSSAPSLSSTLALLGLMLGGVTVALCWLRRRQHAFVQGNGAVDLLASRRLDAHSTLHLVRIGQRVLAIGSSSAGARTLAVIDDPEEIAILASAPLSDGSRDAVFLGRRCSNRTAPTPIFNSGERPFDSGRPARARTEAPA